MNVKIKRVLSFLIFYLVMNFIRPYVIDWTNIYVEWAITIVATIIWAKYFMFDEELKEEISNSKKNCLYLNLKTIDRRRRIGGEEKC